MYGHFFKTPVQCENMGVNKKDYFAKLQKAQALRRNVDQAG